MMKKLRDLRKTAGQIDYASDESVSRMKEITPGQQQTESKDQPEREYDYEGEMAKQQLRTIIMAAQDLEGMISDDQNLPEWWQNKITLAADYMQTARDYMKSDVKESLDEISKDTISRYKKAASKSNYAAAQKYARVAASPTSRKYKNKEMDRQDNIGRKRKAGLAMADRKESLDEKTPVRPTVPHELLKNLRVRNPNYKGGLKRKRDNERSADKFREDNVSEKLTIAKIRRAAYKTGKVLGDVQAVKKNKVARRVKNRMVGKLLGKAVGKLGLFK
jgi:hypothetical protein